MCKMFKKIINFFKGLLTPRKPPVIPIPTPSQTPTPTATIAPPKQVPVSQIPPKENAEPRPDSPCNITVKVENDL